MLIPGKNPTNTEVQKMLKPGPKKWLYVLKRSQMVTLKCKGLRNLEGRDPRAGAKK